ncbi:hypothetical protein ACET9E_14250 [Aeromonas caviae]|uniref:hypothetical protein n=1 Tax=Aeromonas caviae TaxID=648 RepID=UPI0016034141|nr:hypothetical protein [Aeromonas caviae]
MAEWTGLWRITNNRLSMIVKAFRLICSLIVAALLMAVLLALPYLYFREFGFLSKYSWHNDQSWANFGSFIGGTIGPTLSFIAILFVLVSLREQRKLQETSEIQNLIFHDLEEVSRLFKMNIEYCTFTGLPSEIFKMSIRKYGHEYITNREKNHSYFAESYSHAFQIRELIRHICWCFDRYIELGGNKNIINSYKNRLSIDIMFMYHYFDFKDSIVQKHFNIDKMMEVYKKGPDDIEEIWKAAYTF